MLRIIPSDLNVQSDTNLARRTGADNILSVKDNQPTLAKSMGDFYCSGPMKY